MASKRVDWGRFGLASDAEREASETTRLKDPALEEGYYGGQDAELFAEEKVRAGGRAEGGGEGRKGGREILEEERRKGRKGRRLRGGEERREAGKEV